jgi:hypothetical protein
MSTFSNDQRPRKMPVRTFWLAFPHFIFEKSQYFSGNSWVVLIGLIFGFFPLFWHLF